MSAEAKPVTPAVVQRAIETIKSGGQIAVRTTKSEFQPLRQAALKFAKSLHLVAKVEQTEHGMLITIAEDEMPDVSAELKKLALGDSILLRLPREQHQSVRTTASRVGVSQGVQFSCRVEFEGIRVFRVPANDVEAAQMSPHMMKIVGKRMGKYEFERLATEPYYDVEVTPRELDSLRNSACSYGRRNGIKITIRALSDGKYRVSILERL